MKFLSFLQESVFCIFKSQISRRNKNTMKNIAPLCLFLQFFFVKIVSTMDRGKGKAVAEKDVDEGFGIGKSSLPVKNPDILTVHFNGRIEPPIADGKTPYKVHVVSETFEDVKKSSAVIWTGHRFCMPLHFHRKELKKTPTLQQEKLRSTARSHGVQELTVAVETQLPDGKMTKRSWTILHPDFSLQYEFHFGPVEGPNLSFRSRITLPHWFQPKAGDEMAVFDWDENVELGRLPYSSSQWLSMNNVMVNGQALLTNAYRLDISLDAAKLGKFLAENLDNPRIKLMFSRHNMQETVFNAEERAKEIEKDKRRRMMKKSAETNWQHAAETSGHGNGAENLNPPEARPILAPAGQQAAEQSSALNSECAFCLNNFVDDELIWRSKFCNHIHHADCVKTWLKLRNDCPLFCGKKLRSFFLPLYMEGPVFSNGDYNYEYAFSITMSVTSEELRKEDEEANAMAQYRGDEHAVADGPREQQQQHEEGTPSRMVDEEEDPFYELAPKEHTEFMQRQFHFASQHFHFFVNQHPNGMADLRPEERLQHIFDISRLHTLRVFDTDDDELMDDGIGGKGKKKLD